MLEFTYPGPANDVSYHNHTDFSDGAGSLELTCRTGKNLGLRELGISDHYVIHPESGSDQDNWRMDPARLDEYVEQLLKLKHELDDKKFTLRIGLEVDFFFENYEEVLNKLSFYPLDYLIGSVHYAGIFPIDYSAETWAEQPEERRRELCRIYWKKLEGAALCGKFTFLGHLDLPKKFCYMKPEEYLSEAQQVLDAARESGTAIELNTSGWFKDCQEQYPCLAMLKEANARRIPVLINADAHAPAHLKRNFEQAENILCQAGFPSPHPCFNASERKSE